MKVQTKKHTYQGLILVFAFALISAFQTTQAERKPQPKAEITEPKPDQTLSGRTNIKLKLPSNVAGPVYAGIGGPPWIKGDVRSCGVSPVQHRPFGCSGGT